MRLSDPRATAAPSPSRSAPERSAPHRKHFVQFYDRDAVLIDELIQFMGEGLESDGACIVVATREHGASLVAGLEQRGLDVAAHMRSDRFTFLDAAELLGEFMHEDWPDGDRFNDVVGRLIARSGENGARSLRVFGEMVAVLWAAQKREAAIRLETLWNEMGRRHDFSLFCAYPLSAFHGEADVRPLVEVCAAHGHAIPTETYAGLATAEERLKLVIQLQRRALASEGDAVRENEIGKELARREAALAQLSETIGEAVMDVSPTGQILWASAEALRYLGATESPVGLSVSGFLGTGVALGAMWLDLLRGDARGDAVVSLGADVRARRDVRVCANLRLVSQSLCMRWFIRGVPALAE